jgi:hypothetical protein
VSTLTLKRAVNQRTIDEELKDLVSVLAIKWGVAQPMHFYRVVELYNTYLAGLMFSRHREPVKVKTLVTNQLKAIQLNGEEGKGLTTNEYGCGVLLGFYFLQLRFWEQASREVRDKAVREINNFTIEVRHANDADTIGHIQRQAG